MIKELKDGELHFVVEGHYYGNDVNIPTGGSNVLLNGDRNKTKLHNSTILGNGGTHYGNHNKIYGDNFSYNGNYGELHGSNITILGGTDNVVYGTVNQDRGAGTKIHDPVPPQAHTGADYATKIAVEQLGLPAVTAEEMSDEEILAWTAMKCNLPPDYFYTIQVTPSKKRKRSHKEKKYPVPHPRAVVVANSDAPLEEVCGVCQANKRQIMFLHDEDDDSSGCLIICSECTNLDYPNCPKCRKNFRAMVYVYD